MTKKQLPGSPRTRLDPDTVVRVAPDLLDGGLDERFEFGLGRILAQDVS